MRVYRLPVIAIVLFSQAACSVIYPISKYPTTGGATATGGKLWVDHQTHVSQHVEQQKVAEAHHRDSQGNSLGTTEVFEDKVVTTRHIEWYPMQDEDRLDDEDFFRIAGDSSGLTQTQSYRRGGMAMNKVGRYALIGGIAAVAASLFVSEKHPTLQTTLWSAGMSVGGAGWYFAWSGDRRLKPGSHGVTFSRAQQTAHRYNGRGR